MTQRNLSVEELRKLNIKNDKDKQSICQAIFLMEYGEKVIVKEVKTAGATKINIYLYDKSLYRFVKTDTIII